jgi:predicted DNA-binding transcriptional regulator YafY
MADVSPLLRQWTLLRLLDVRRQGATLREMSDETGVSPKTITRDLNLLRRVGFPLTEIVSDHGRKHWKLGDAARQPSLGFTLEEAAALYLGRQFLEGLAGTLFWSGAQSAFQKIRAALGEPALRHLQKLASTVYLHSHALADYSGRAELIDQLMTACRVASIFRDSTSYQRKSRFRNTASGQSGKASQIGMPVVTPAALSS